MANRQIITPADLIIRRASGVDDIAQTIYPCHDAGVYALSSLRIFYSAGASSSTVTLSVDHRLGPTWDFELIQMTASGGGGRNILLGIAGDELKEWYFVVEHSTERDGLKIAQVLGTADVWALEAAFIDAKNI